MDCRLCCRLEEIFKFLAYIYVISVDYIYVISVVINKKYVSMNIMSTKSHLNDENKPNHWQFRQCLFTVEGRFLLHVKSL